MNPEPSSRRSAEPRWTGVAPVADLPRSGIHNAMGLHRKGARAQRRTRRGWKVEDGAGPGAATSRPGRLKIAQRLIAGTARVARPSPGGTADGGGWRRVIAGASFVPDGTYARRLGPPSDASPGYALSPSGLKDGGNYSAGTKNPFLSIRTFPTRFAPLRLCVFALKSRRLLFGFWLVCQSASAQLQLLPDDEPQRVLAGQSRPITARFHNAGATTAEAEIRIQLYQASATTAAPLGDAPWKRLPILPGQTVLEAATLTFPDVRAETRFLVRWVAGTNHLLGTSEVLAYPTHLLAELKSLAAEEALGIFDPGNQLKPLLRLATVAFTDLEDAGIATFRGRLAIFGPFATQADMPTDLPSRVGEMVRKGVAAVWLQPPPGPHDKLQPSFYTLPLGTNAVVVAQASLVANLAESPRSQLNLLDLCRAALSPEPPRLPLGPPEP